MTLSEAIRIGAMLKPQAFGGCHVTGATCALGAAVEAIGALRLCVNGYMPTDDAIAALATRWPYIDSVVSNPITGDGGDLSFVIFELNDTHRWTRDQIADFVESIERSLEPSVAKDGEAETVVSVSLVSDAEVLIPVSQ